MKEEIYQDITIDEVEETINDLLAMQGVAEGKRQYEEVTAELRLWQSLYDKKMQEKRGR